MVPFHLVYVFQFLSFSIFSFFKTFFLKPLSSLVEKLLCVCMYVCMYACMCVYIYIYIHIVCIKVKVLVTQLRLTLCDPMDCSPSGSSVHGILWAIILEWAAISFYRGSSQSRD